MISNIQKSIIEKHCKPFIEVLNSYEHQLLYSVLPIPNDNNIIKIKNYVYDSPNIPGYLKDAFNVTFEKYYKRPYCKGMHCSFVPQNITDGYHQYAIFPVGEFTYCWSPQITGIFEYYVSHTSPNRIDHEYDYNEVMDYVDHEVRYKYVNNNIIDAVDKPNEIMIYCDEYLAVPVDSQHIRVINETITRTPSSIRG
jgi:hypothetical protein